MSSAYEPSPRHAAPVDVADRDRSLGELLGHITQDLSTLMRQEVQLAKVELRQSATQGGRGVGMYAGAGVAGFLFLLFGSISLWWGLGHWMGNTLSALVVGVLWAIVAVVLISAGRREMSRVQGLPTTAETVSKIPNALKGNEEENR